MTSLTNLLIGRPVANREAASTKIGVFAGLPAMGLDGLASAAYGPEAALAILAVTGGAGLADIGPIMAAILALLAIVWSSYWQTIAAYPGNGGAYVVAKDNLGTNAGLFAAAALMVDYTLNVAVAISAGVGALISAAPSLHGYALPLCLGILALLTVMNLRGTRESGLLWSLPTYLFVISLGATLAWGTGQAAMAGGHPQPVVPPPNIPPAAQPVTLWLILRAFASGCTAMTGVEAVSNGVSAFQEPKVKRAHGTLSAIVVILAFLLIGVAHLAHAYGVGAMDQSQPGYRSVLSQLISAVAGEGPFYYVTIGSVLAVLCLSANTSFVDLPRMSRLVARDGFLPAAFAVPGRRLVYSVGILFLAGAAGGLLVAFGGITDRLIPLFAVGAFLSFTLSQAGMATHWWRNLHRTDEPQKPSRRRWRSSYASIGKLAVNGGGAIATGMALAIILVAKFVEGAWLTVIVIPCFFVLFKLVRQRYDYVERQLQSDCDRALDLSHCSAPVALVPIKRWDQVARKALRFALCLAADVTAVHLTALEGPEADQDAARLRRRWRSFVEQPAEATGMRPPRLLLTTSQYRSLLEPLLRGVKDINERFPGRAVIVVLPELVEAHWWEYVLHTHRERYVRARLVRYGGEALSVLSVPWQLEPTEPEEGIAEATEGRAAS
jgi:amino acid transporter